MDITELRGIVTVLNTPFTDSGSVAPAALADNVEYAVHSGVAGFLVPAMASEVGALEQGERELVVETVLSAAAGRVPVIVGVSGTTADVRMAATKHAVRVGAPAVLVALGGSAGEVAEELYRVADAGAKAVILQDWDPAGLGLPVETILELAEDVPALAGVKIEVAAAGAKYSAVLEAAGARLLVCGGWAVGQLIEALDRGVHAFMPTGLHAQYCEIVRRYRSGDRDGAQQVFRDLLPVLAFANQHLDISIHFFKRLLWRQGIYPTPAVRAPRLPFDDIHRRTADELIDHTLDHENALRARRRG